MKFIVASFHIIWRIIREIRRWRNRHSLPRFQVSMVGTPYWGGIELPVVLTNTGSMAGRDCRYCRYQRFAMDPGSTSGRSPVAASWYATNMFNAPVGGGGIHHVAFATKDACPHIVLGDVVERRGSSATITHAVVCRDKFGTHYRFQLEAGEDATPDIWRKSLWSRSKSENRPPWTTWLDCPSMTQSHEWAAQFS